MKKFIASRQFFTVWFGIGIPPFLIGTVVVAFYSSWWLGCLTSLIVATWTYDTFKTTCRRCPFYGTGKCGIPGLLVPHLFKKRSAFDISTFRIRIHYYADLLMILYVNLVYWTVPVLFPVVAVCSIIGWWTVFRPKKFHGLLFRLPERKAAQTQMKSNPKLPK